MGNNSNISNIHKYNKKIISKPKPRQMCGSSHILQQKNHEVKKKTSIVKGFFLTL